MAKLSHSAKALADLGRLSEFFEGIDSSESEHTVELIDSAIRTLKSHPLIGCIAGDEMLRELIISRGSTGYIALYQYDEVFDDVLVVSIRHQREVGYTEQTDS